ncbi:MAG: HEAT repeat domain-containing protein [Nitrospirota bacterium]
MRKNEIFKNRLLIFLLIGVVLSLSAVSPVVAARRIKIGKIIDKLKSENVQQRRIAALELGDLKNPKALDALIDALSDKDRAVRMNVVWALGRIKDKKAISPLKGVSESDKLSEVREAALAAIKRIEGSK